MALRRVLKEFNQVTETMPKTKVHQYRHRATE
jgi:hypothetical protein